MFSQLNRVSCVSWHQLLSFLEGHSFKLEKFIFGSSKQCFLLDFISNFYRIYFYVSDLRKVYSISTMLWQYCKHLVYYLRHWYVKCGRPHLGQDSVLLPIFSICFLLLSLFLNLRLSHSGEGQICMFFSNIVLVSLIVLLKD